MDKKTITIISNENKIKIPLFYNQCEEDHKSSILKFLYRTGVSIEDTSDTITMSKLLVDQGFCIILTSEYEKIRNVEIFIPEKISSNQLEYFEHEKVQKELTGFNIVLYKYSENEQLEIINKSNTEEPILDTLMKELNNRFKANIKVKQLKQSFTTN